MRYTNLYVLLILTYLLYNSDKRRAVSNFHNKPVQVK